MNMQSSLAKAAYRAGAFLLAFLIAFGLVAACDRKAPGARPPRPGVYAGPAVPTPPGQIGPFVIPPSWAQASWYIDPQNTSTCASDSNLTCSSSACTTGDGPCLTFGSVASRWGTYAPRLRQNTTITIMSGQSSGDADPLYLDPALENQASLFVTGTTTTVGTGTFTALTAKNRATPQQLTVTLSAATGAAQWVQLINSTHAGECFLDTNTSGNIWTLTQPLVSAQTTAIGTGAKFGSVAAEVDTFASGDAYTLYSFPYVKIAEVKPSLTRWNAAGGGGVYISNLRIGTQAGAQDPVYVGAPVLFGDTVTIGIVAGVQNNGSWSNASSSFAYMQEWYNSVETGGVWYVGQPQDQPTAKGATALFLGGAMTALELEMGYVDLEQDIYLQSASHGTFFLLGGKLAGVYTADNLIANVAGAVVNIAPDLNGGNATIWGPGGYAIGSNNMTVYPSGAGGAAGAFLMTGIFDFAGLFTTCNIAYATDSGSSPAITLTAANLDTTFGANSGCCYQPGGGRICNHL